MPDTVVLDVRGVQWASEKARVEAILGRRPGVLSVEANPVAQNATITFDGAQTSVGALRDWVRDCGYHCAGQSVPNHVCDPLATGDDGHDAHDDMSMASMVTDMRNRFLVAALFSVPIVLWSPIGRDVLNFSLAAPFGLRDDVWSLLLSLPVIFYSCSIFFVGAFRALRARTLDMMVLVAVAVGAGWLYSVAVTLTGGGDVFYEAASVLAAFVLLGHWFEMRARGGANDAIRTLLDLAPPTAVVLRDGEPVEVPTSEVVVGDLLLVRPGSRIAVDGVVEDGDSEVDESMVTGESLPVHKEPGATVIGATINKNGTLRVRATKVGADTALAQIVKLVQEAQNSKAPGQRLAGPGRVLARPRGADRRRAHVPRLVPAERPPTHGRGSVRDHGGRHHLPRRPRAGDADRDHGRHRAGAKRGVLFKNAVRARDRGPHRGRRHGQDRDAHEGRAGGDRRRRRRHRRAGAARPGGGGRAGVRASARRRRRPVCGCDECTTHAGRVVRERAGTRRLRERRRSPRRGRQPPAHGAAEDRARPARGAPRRSSPTTAAPRCSSVSTDKPPA